MNHNEYKSRKFEFILRFLIVAWCQLLRIKNSTMNATLFTKSAQLSSHGQMKYLVHMRANTWVVDTHTVYITYSCEHCNITTSQHSLKEKKCQDLHQTFHQQPMFQEHWPCFSLPWLTSEFKCKTCNKQRTYEFKCIQLALDYF